MMGYGSYYSNNSGGSSNLSALAPPFTVDRSVSKPVLNPLVDLSEPTNYVGGVTLNPSFHNWLNSHPPNSRLDFFPMSNAEFDSPQPSSTPYGYSTSVANVPPVNPLASASVDPVSWTSFVEATPYYSSYIPSNVGDDGSYQSGYDLLSTSHVATSDGSSSFNTYSQGLEHSAHWSGLWEGQADWQQSKPVQLDGSLCGKENYIDQGFYPSMGLSDLEVASHGIDVVGREKYAESTNLRHLDYESFLVENSNCMPSIGCSISTSASTSAVPVNIPHVPKPLTSRNHQFTHSSPYENKPGKYDTRPNNSAPMMKPSPAVVIRSPEQDLCSVENINSDKEADDKGIASNSPSLVKEDRSYKSFGDKVHYDPSQICFHLKQCEEPQSNKSNLFHGLDHFSGAKPGIQVPSASLDGFNLAIDNGEATNSAENYSISNSLDHYNPAVDSPCWKGAPICHLSPFKISESATTQNMKKVEAFNGSNLQVPQTFPLIACDALKCSSEKPSQNFGHHNGGDLESCFGPLKWSFVREETDVGLKSGSHATKGSFSQVAQNPDDIDELNEQCAHTLPSKLVNSSDLKTSHSEQQCPEEHNWTSEKDCASGKDGADTGINVNDDCDGCSSHVPMHAIENVLHSPPSEEKVLTDLTHSHGGESAAKMDVGTLVNTIHNLSELLIFSCLNDKFALKDEHHSTLEDTINNLDTCILKNVERMAATQETFIPNQSNSELLGKLSSIHKNASQDMTQAARADDVHYESLLKNQHIQAEENKVVSGKKDAILSKFSARSAADMVKDDNMTQAIKNVLAQNFHNEEETDPQILLYKNLWLEAEASLCSVNCIARFDRMKIEMETCNSQKENVLPPNNVVIDKPSMSDAKGEPVPNVSVSDRPILGASSHDNLMARLQILNSHICNLMPMNTSDVKTLSSSDIYPDWSRIEQLAREVYDDAKADKSMQDSPKSLTTSQADDVTTRCQILKTCLDKSSSMNTSSPEKPFSSKCSFDLNKFDKLAHEGNDVSEPAKSIQEFFKPATSSLLDDVTARFDVDSPNFVNTSAVEKSSSEDSPDLNVVHKLAHEIKDGAKQNIPTQDISMRSTTTQADDVTSGFHLLKGRVNNSNFLNTSAVERFSTSMVLPDQINVNKIGNEMKDSAKQDISIQDSSMLRTTSHEDDVEASVMVRFRILKGRVDNSSSMHMEKYQPGWVDLGYTGLRRHQSVSEDALGDRILDVNVEPASQNHASTLADDKSILKEFHLFGKNDPLTQLHMTGMIGDQPRAVWHDSSSSDWEHVLKEELLGQNC